MKTIALFLPLFFISQMFMKLYAENGYAKNDISFSLNTIPTFLDFELDDNIYILDVDYSRKLKSFLSVGGYTGIGLYQEWSYSHDGQGNSSFTLEQNELNTIGFGVNSTLHLIPLFVKSNFRWADVYITGKAGAISMLRNVQYDRPARWENIRPAKGTYFDVSVKGGIKLCPTRSLGIFGEYGYRLFGDIKGFHTSFGIFVRF